jgi:hypothetical protein
MHDVCVARDANSLTLSCSIFSSTALLASSIKRRSFIKSLCLRSSSLTCIFQAMLGKPVADTPAILDTADTKFFILLWWLWVVDSFQYNVHFIDLLQCINDFYYIPDTCMKSSKQRLYLLCLPKKAFVAVSMKIRPHKRCD